MRSIHFDTSIIKNATLCVVLFCITQSSFAQISASDVIDGGVAAARKQGFHNRFHSNSKPTTRAYYFKVEDLQAILNEYKAAGVSEVVFIPSLIRSGDDVNRYVAKHPGTDRVKLANRTTLLIKSPTPGSASLKTMWFRETYYDLARICPPPDNCIE